jgi:hypothetical protein
MPLQATSGVASYDAFGGGVAVVPNYIEDVFSTYLYTGTDTNPNTIVNGVDLSTNGGMVWCKRRVGADSHSVWDTARGVKNFLIPNATNKNSNIPVENPGFTTYGLQSFNTNGFTLGRNWEGENGSGVSLASWTFRKQPKFFDVLTYTGTGSNTTISHSLGSVPACIIVKRTDAVGAWQVYHRSLANTEYLVLNSTDAKATGATRWNSTTPTSTVFSIGTDATVNASGGTYVAYLFAHDAGGFGLTGTDNVISCSSFTTDGSGNYDLELGYEPQWYLQKQTDAGAWWMTDTMRGFNNLPTKLLRPHLADAEYSDTTVYFTPTATGVKVRNWSASTTYIYIAIRRGPMKVPTSGTSVFSQTLTSSNANPLTITTNFPVDMTINRYTGESSNYVFDRLRGANASAVGTTATYLKTEATSAEAVIGTIGDNMQSNTTLIDRSLLAGTSDPKIYYSFRRAPSFFDEVCYTGNGSTQTITHNLGVAPELIIGKCRTTAGLNWAVSFDFAPTTQSYAFLNLADAGGIGVFYAGAGVFTAAPTSTSMFLDSSGSMNTSGAGQVAYLFATCAGVSKVGTYTGTGTTLQVNCGFTAGSRFVLIKRVDSTGDWYVWDSARGIVAGNDPYLLLNSTAAEVTNTDYVDTYSAGFEISSTAPAAINANNGKFIFLAVS